MAERRNPEATQNKNPRTTQPDLPSYLTHPIDLVMVHGGGHHHSSGGGGGSSQRSSSYSSSHFGSRGHGGGHHLASRGVTTYHYQTGPSSTVYYHPPGVYPATTSYHSNHSEDCCRDCALVGCTLCCCLCWGSGRNPLPNDNPHWKSQAPNLCCPWICLTIIMLFVVLIVISSGEVSWNLEAGETRQVPLGMGTRSISVDGFHIDVYRQPGSCPALSGSIQLQHDEQLHLEPDDYQFDSFYLTQDSAIHMMLQQQEGATNVIVIRGIVPNDDDDSWDHPLRKQFISSTMEPVTLDYRAPRTDQYTIVYDNASGSAGDLTVTYNVTLRTYDLTQATRVCSNPLQDCVVEKHNPECVIVFADESTVVDIVYHHQWSLLIGLVLTPLVMGLLRIGAYVRRSANHTFGPDNDPPVAIHVPSTIPEAIPLQRPQGSDVGLTNDYENLPIAVAENVVPVPMSDNKVTL